MRPLKLMIHMERRASVVRRVGDVTIHVLHRRAVDGVGVRAVDGSTAEHTGTSSVLRVFPVLSSEIDLPPVARNVWHELVELLKGTIKEEHIVLQYEEIGVPHHIAVAAVVQRTLQRTLMAAQASPCTAARLPVVRHSCPVADGGVEDFNPRRICDPCLADVCEEPCASVRSVSAVNDEHQIEPVCERLHALPESLPEKSLPEEPDELLSEMVPLLEEPSLPELLEGVSGGGSGAGDSEALSLLSEDISGRRIG